MVLRDHVVSVLQHPVERPRVRDETRPIGRLDQLFDERIDGFVFDAEDITAPLLVSGL